MNPLHRLKPQAEISEGDVQQGLRMVLFDGICSQIMGVLTGGAFLVAFALLLGASNKVIGLIAAAGPLTQLLQIPAIYLVERSRMRKLLVVAASFLSRLFWIGIALIPWFLPEPARIPALLIFLFLYFGLGTLSGGAWTSWMRDLIPENIMGSYFGNRLAIATLLSAVLSIFAGLGLDLYKKHFQNEIGIYPIIFLVGAAAGLLGIYFLSKAPEPQMAPVERFDLFQALGKPFRQKNFRQLLIFLGWWSFAVNLAAPFFTVYMLKRLGLGMGMVLGLSVLSQLVNVAFLKWWGPLADKFSNKSVLAASGPLFILSIGLWPFTTMPDKYFLTIPLLVLIHMLAGMSTAGVTLASFNIAMKLAPRGDATAYLATNALVSGVAATLAPILAGFGADWFAGQELSVLIRWSSEHIGRHFQVVAMDLRSLDFLFILAVIAGFYALARLIAVQEEGEVEEDIVLPALFSEVRKSVRHVSNVAGLRTLVYFPYSRLERFMKKII
ncbi:MAG: MFS transporter [Candidatus Omnitrophica bacterium]|nr:MFS transporter [Candidatus Omnitrophota bacterium]